MTKIPCFLRAGPKKLDSKTEPSKTMADFCGRYSLVNDFMRGAPLTAGAPPAVKNKTRLQQFLARRRPSLSRETGIRLISLSIARAHARTGRDIDLDWD